MTAGLLQLPPTSPHDVNLEPMVCNHARNLSAIGEWPFSVDWITDVRPKKKVSEYSRLLVAVVQMHRGLCRQTKYGG